MTPEEFAHYNQLRQITKQRKNGLEEQIAAYGPNSAPQHLKIDLKAAQEELDRIEAKMKLLSISPIIQEATGPEAGLDVLRQEVKDLRNTVNTMMQWVTKEILEIGDIIRSSQEESREWRVGAAYYRRLTWIAGSLFSLVFLALLLLLAYRLGAGR